MYPGLVEWTPVGRGVMKWWIGIAITAGCALLSEPILALHGAPEADPIAMPSAWRVSPSGRMSNAHKLRSRTTLHKVHDNHYLFGPSAIPLEGGTGYYQNQDILVQSAFYAPVEGLTLGVGVQMASLVSSVALGAHGPMAYFRVNGGGHVGKGLYLGGFVMGVRIGKNYTLSDSLHLPASIGVGAAQATFNADPVHVTVSVGATADQDGHSRDPLLGLAGLWHITDRVAFITENWSIPFGENKYRTYSYGARFTHRAMAFDAAFLVNKDLSEFFVLGLPVLGFSLRL